MSHWLRLSGLHPRIFTSLIKILCKKRGKSLRGKIKPLSLHPQSRNKRWFEKVTIAKWNDLVAQLVEQMTLNHWVEGSSPSQVTRFTYWKDGRVVDCGGLENR